MPVRRRHNKRKLPPPEAIGCTCYPPLPDGHPRKFLEFAPCDACGYDGNLTEFLRRSHRLNRLNGAHGTDEAPGDPREGEGP
jgi:hypothetical protein